MKNIILFLLFLAACGSNPLSTIQNIETSCPKVLFASEHNTYFDTKSTLINLDNIAYSTYFGGSGDDVEGIGPASIKRRPPNSESEAEGVR